MKKISISPIILLLAIVVFAYWRWFLIGNIYTWADWGFHFRESIQLSLDFPRFWEFGGLGQIDVSSSTYPIKFIWAIASKFVSFEISEKLLFMFPIVLIGAFSSYHFIHHQVKHRVAAFVGALVIMLNTYTLMLATGHLNLLAAFVFSLPTFLFFQKALETNYRRHYIYAILLSFVVCAYDFRIFYLLAGVLFLYISLNLLLIERKKFDRIRVIKNVLISFAIIVILNLYWLLTFTQLGQISSNVIFNRSLFGNEFLSLINALFLFHPFWNGSKPIFFLIQDLPAHFVLIPVFAILGLYFGRKNMRIIIFGIICLVGLLLTKQSAPPLTTLYEWLYGNLPGFNAFREASKFFMIVVIGYSVLIASFIKWIWQNWNDTKLKVYAKYSLVIVISFVFLWNAKPLVTSEFGTLFVPRSIPEGYKKLKNQIINDQSFYRTLWVPVDSRWGFYNKEHPKVSSVQLMTDSWKENIEGVDDGSITGGEITELLKKPYTKNLFDSASIGKVIVPQRDQQNDGDFFVYYGNDREHFLDALDKTKWLQKVDNETKDLAVYENKNHKPYFSSFTELYGFPAGSSLEPKYNFLNDNLNKDEVNFSWEEDRSLATNNGFIDVFENITAQDIKDGRIKKKINKNESEATIYALIGNTQVKYTKIANDYVFIFKNPDQAVINNVAASSPQENRQINIPIDSNKSYYAEKGEKLYDILTQENTQRNLGIIGHPLPIFASNNDGNLVSNFSFEDGLWQKAVSDCNPYDSNAFISMDLEQNKSADGQKSLALHSSNHIACTNTPPIKVSAGKKYKVKFAYQSENTSQVGYELQFNDINGTKEKFKIPASYNEWKYSQKSFIVPEGATEVSLVLKGYPETHLKLTAKTYYDDIEIKELQTITTLLPNTARNFNQSKVGDGEVNIEYVDSSYDYQNIIKNGSFEDGLWRQTVGDCNAYDDKPKLKMILNENEKSDGQKSLQLEAENHIACTGPESIQVEENSIYLFNFDYQSSNSNQASFYISFDDPNSTTFSEDIPINDKGWQTLSKQIKVPYGATSLSLAVYAHSGEGKNIINRYDNFKLIKIPELTDSYYYVEDNNQKLNIPKDINFELNSSTKKTILIKSATTPFFIAMSESYHDKWHLRINDAESDSLSPWAKPTAVAKDHFELNGFINGWYVDVDSLCKEQKLCKQNDDGSYDIEMVAEFTPQRWFYVGSFISGTAFIGIVGYLGYDWRKNRKSRKDKKENQYQHPSSPKKPTLKSEFSTKSQSAAANKKQ